MKKKNWSHSSARFLICPLVSTALLACTPADAPSVDLIVEGEYIVSMDEDQNVIRNGAVAIKDGLIVAMGPADDINAEYTAAEHIKGEDRVVMPGLVNGHQHAAMTLLRGVADDLALLDWLTNYIFPAEVEFVDAEFVRIGTELACWEMMRGGTTTFVDMYYYPDVIAEVVESCGLREFIGRWKNRNSRITPIFGPHANYTLNVDQLRATRAAANDAGVGISIHMSESPFELQYSKDNFGKTSIELFESIGFFDGPTIAAHVVWPTDVEIPILAERRVGVIHNPSSNMKLASGVSPITEMLRAGVLVGLGTDGAASNNDLDMWEEMRLAAFLQKVDRMDPEVLSAQTVLTMATSGGAEAIGLREQIGALSVGMKADLIQVSFDDVHFIPTYDVISHLVYVADEQDVSTVIVDGKALMREKEILTVDTERVAREANELADRIQATLAERNREAK
jgi:5-methylthioadenosine/S-adenosylhomocysteine deaminase